MNNKKESLIVLKGYNENDCIACLPDYGSRPTNIIWPTCH